MGGDSCGLEQHPDHFAILSILIIITKQKGEEEVDNKIGEEFVEIRIIFPCFGFRK